MARATRSSANVEQANKKRKRDSSPHEKPQKLIRTAEQKGSVADSTLPDDDARQILEVLETADSLGLLDRVFPLSPSSSDQTFSFRTLLSEPKLHSLRVLRAAVQHLYPLSSHPRSNPSETASQQLRFCTLALSLLDQASRNILPLSLDTSSFLSSESPDSPTDESKPPLPSSPSSSIAKPRYALVQHLPSGAYWSSLNNERTTSLVTQAKDLFTGYADLVSILPTSFPSQNPKSDPTLGSYSAAKSSSTKRTVPAQRRVTLGVFLDYGPWTSFAPSFDHEGEIVGRRELGEALWYKHEKKIKGEAELREWIEGKGSIVEVQEENQDKEDRGSIDIEPELDGLLPPEVIQSLKTALCNAELENLIDELLARNQRALIRLQELQIDRLTKEGLGSATIDESSEEWEIAHGIMESLETLALLRPQTASGQTISIVPPVSILRKLHKTLALEPRPGWHGTLAPTRAIALRDDLTVKVRASSVVPTALSTSSSPAPTSITPTTSTVTAATTTPYAGYTYAYSTQQQTQTAYRPAAAAAAGTTAYAQYKPSAYYQNYALGTQQQPQHQYYGQQAYGAGATSQQPYAAYSSWFAHAQYSQIGAAGTASTGRGTPQPVAAYGTFYAQQQQQQRANSTTGAATPAVANTVATNKTGTGTGAATGAWAGYTGQQQGSVPTLPAHLRPTPVVANGYQSQQQQGYYAGYQVPQQSQQPAGR